MTIHWTYEAASDKNEDLRQGDILFPSTELLQVLGEVNSQASYRKPLGFMVITQCCDLVRRGKKPCKANYISVVEIHDLVFVVQELLDAVCEKIAKDIFLHESKASARELLTRLFNQNEQAFGLFYLHPCQESTGLVDEAVALLRVSRPIPTTHYQTLLNSRRSRLTSEFRNKVGWLVGNLYSRVGTPDWSERTEGKRELDSLVEKFVDAEPFLWIRKSYVQTVEKHGINLGQLPREEVLYQLGQFKPKPAAELIATEAQHQLESVLTKLPRDIAGAVSKSTAGILKNGSTDITSRTILEHIEGQLITVLESLPTDIAQKISGTVIDSLGAELQNAGELRSKLQDDIEEAIRKNFKGIPQKLSGRLSNSTVIRGVTSREDFD